MILITLPEFETDEAHDYFITRIFIREGFNDYKNKTASDGGSTTPKLPPNYPQADSQKMILSMVRQNSKITRKGIAEKLGVSVDGARYHLKKLSDAGILTYEGTSRNGHWVIREDALPYDADPEK